MAQIDRMLNELAQAWCNHYAEAHPHDPVHTPAEHRILRSLQTANLSPAFDRRPAERIRQRLTATHRATTTGQTRP